jgi:hypothetical protein
MASEGSVQGSMTEHPGEIAPTKPLSSSAGSPIQQRALQQGVRRHWRRAPRHEGSWASNFFKQLLN